MKNKIRQEIEDFYGFVLSLFGNDSTHLAEFIALCIVMS